MNIVNSNSSEWIRKLFEKFETESSMGRMVNMRRTLYVTKLRSSLLRKIAQLQDEIIRKHCK